MTLRSFVRRHADELGPLRAVHRGGPGLGTVAAVVAVWVLFSGLTLIRPAESLALVLAAPVAFAIIAAAILVMLGGERVAVCERGLVIGSVAPGLRPYLLRYDQIVPGSVVPVRRSRRFPRETGSFVASTNRLGWWSGDAVYLVGPSPREARRHRAVLAHTLDPPPTTVDGRWPWIAGVRTDSSRVVAQIADAAIADGHRDLGSRAGSAMPRELTGRPQDAAEQLPGMPGSPR